MITRNLLLPLLTLPTLAAAAQPAPPPMPILALGGYLELSPGQRDAIHKLLDGSRSAIETRRFATHQAQRALQAALGDPAGTEAQIRALCGKESQARLEESLELHAHFRAALALLTPEQKAKLQKAQAEMPLLREVMEHRGGPGGQEGQEGPGGFAGPGGPGGLGAKSGMQPPPGREGGPAGGPPRQD